MELFEEWQGSFEPERQAAIWAEMLDLYTSQCFTLGLVQEVRQPLAVRREPAQPARGGDLQLGAAGPDRALPAGHVLLRRVRLDANHRSAGSFSSQRLLSKVPGDSGSWPITPQARRSAWRVAR